MQYRHEWKQEINAADRLVLLARLGTVMQPDPHAVSGSYRIRSLYFDSPEDRALREKLDGVDRREKFRLRFYNNDPGYLVLEKKCRLGGLSAKQSCPVTEDEVRRLLAGELDWMQDPARPLCGELRFKMLCQGLRPRTIVDYLREPFVFAPGNVRVTIDRELRTGDFRTDFLDPGILTLPAGEATILLELKWDAFLPDIIRDAVNLPGRRVTAFSKYARCRIYG